MQNRIRFVGKDLMKYINYINKKIDKKSYYRWRRERRAESFFRGSRVRLPLIFSHFPTP